MSKFITASQGNLDLARNRPQRRLEATDFQLEDVVDIVNEQILPEGIQFCEYISKCNRACFKKDGEYCGIRKFYNRWGIN